MIYSFLSERRSGKRTEPRIAHSGLDFQSDYVEKGLTSFMTKKRNISSFVYSGKCYPNVYYVGMFWYSIQNIVTINYYWNEPEYVYTCVSWGCSFCAKHLESFPQEACYSMNVSVCYFVNIVKATCIYKIQFYTWIHSHWTLSESRYTCRAMILFLLKKLQKKRIILINDRSLITLPSLR